jgi:serine kinase of HPr protein (carbohydrate metabolism regulator)
MLLVIVFCKTKKKNGYEMSGFYSFTTSKLIQFSSRSEMIYEFKRSPNMEF